MNIVLALALLVFLLHWSGKKKNAARSGARQTDSDWVDRLEELNALIED